MPTKQNSSTKPTVVNEEKSKVKEAVDKVTDTLENSYKRTKENIENGDAEQNLKDSIKSGKQKTEEIGRKIKDSVIDTIDVFKEELESSESKASIDGKIHESKKILKSAKKDIKDRF
jgi:hypothetical protein